MERKRLADLWLRYKVAVLSAILSIYCLPPSFYSAPGGELDGSWIRAMNMAIKKHLVFGSDIIFTYGPLSFLSTRNGQNISGIFILLGDGLLFAGFYHIVRKYLLQYKGWFFILLAALLCFKGSAYVPALFMVFIFFTIFNINNNFRNNFELVYCSIAGILLFFIKVNYGLISMCMLAAMALLLIFRNRKALIVLMVSCLVVFFLIYCNVHIDIGNYIKYSIPLIQYYDESMLVEIQPKAQGFVSAMALIALFLTFVGCYKWKLVLQRRYTMDHLIPVILVCAACYLFYKNGFTRFDFFHYTDFYCIFPVFFIFVLFNLDFGKYVISKIAALLVLVLSIVNLQERPLTLKDSYNYTVYAAYTSVINYFSGIFGKQVEFITVNIPRDELKHIGNATIDIMPKQIALLHLNHLNYDPRPVIQTYSAYCPVLDSLNARHFCRQGRPDMVMIKDGSIDNRYFGWDESVTKATLHLNYVCNDSVFFIDSMANNTPYTFLLLHSKKESGTYPKFEKMGEATINFDDTAKLNFPDSIAVYMTAEMVYTTQGKVKKLFYQPPLINVAFLLDGNERSFRAVRPILAGPVLINKFMNDNAGLSNFFTGNIRALPNIRAFVFHANSRGLDRKIKITYFRFVNY